MTKKVPIDIPAPTRTPTVSDWVKAPATEPMRRLTIDLPASLHAKLKATCAYRGTKMVDVIREFIEREVAETQK